MKIATFNINNVNCRLPNLLRWLRAARPDVACLQELKSSDDDFPVQPIEKAGYGAVWRGQKTWNGVAILARNAEPVLIRTELPGDLNDSEARYIEAAVNGIIVTSLYLPNGNPQPGPKFDYKLKWFKRLKSHAAKFIEQDIPVVLAGDYNVAPTEFDIYPTRSWDKDALVQPKSRAAFKSLVAQGWCDAIRELHPSKPMYTFWDYKRNRWPRDAGLRLDHLLLSPALAPRLIKAGVDRKLRGEEGASDHAPAWIVLRFTSNFRFNFQQPALFKHNSALPRRDAPELCRYLPPNEGAGKAGCALHPRSRAQIGKRKRTRAYRFSGGNPAFPARWFTAYFALSPAIGFLVTVIGSVSCQLDAGIEASGPHDFAVRLGAVRQWHISVHRIPPRVRDDRDTPLGWDETNLDMK